MILTNVLVGIAIAVGLMGIVVPVLPGVLLVWGAIGVWALVVGTPTGWAVFGLSTVLLAAGTVIKFVLPGRRLKTSGVPNTTLWLGALLGIIGFFVVPVVGLFLGFVLGVYLAEAGRVGPAAAKTSTMDALKAVGLSMAIELTAALLATCSWIVGLVLVGW